MNIFILHVITTIEHLSDSALSYHKFQDSRKAFKGRLQTESHPSELITSFPLSQEYRPGISQANKTLQIVSKYYLLKAFNNW